VGAAPQKHRRLSHAGGRHRGLWAYGKLGREEDPPFTIKTMVVKTVWPGATATDTLQQVTDRIEKKLEELPFLDFVRSYTKPGESVVFVNLKDTVRAAGGPAALVPGAQEDRRYPPDAALRHRRPFSTMSSATLIRSSSR
jgi:hypothetical protein